jgi:hypothetical protein
MTSRIERWQRHPGHWLAGEIMLVAVTCLA